MLINQDTAQNIEWCFYQSHIAFTQQFARTMHHGQYIKLSTGAIFISDKDSLMSQVIGWGFAEDADFDAEIAQIEHFYKEQGHSHCDIELSPYCVSGLATKLNQHGYYIDELSTVSTLTLGKYKRQKHAAKIKLVDKEDAREWAEVVAKAFGMSEAKNEFILYASAKNTYPFAAYVDGKIAAGGTIAIHDEYCDLGFTATLNEYRGQGLQKALLFERLNFAKKQKADIALVATEPKSISDANVQKAGFTPAYTRIKFRKNL